MVTEKPTLRHARVSEAEPSRYIPEATRHALRKEAGFGCPVSDCRNPYLEYHHFDPPWHKEKHNDPNRMIALCAMHHAQADNWTVDQVRAMKVAAMRRSPGVDGRFNWMRRKMLGVVGGNYFYEVDHLIAVGSSKPSAGHEPIIWFNRDESGYLLLNVRMLSLSGQRRVEIRDNDWISHGTPLDLQSPPKGNKLIAKYSNGDYLSIVFRDHGEPDSLFERFPEFPVQYGSEFEFPLVTVEVRMTVADSDFDLSPARSTIAGNTFTGGLTMHGHVGFLIPPIQRARFDQNKGRARKYGPHW